MKLSRERFLEILAVKDSAVCNMHDLSCIKNIISDITVEEMLDYMENYDSYMRIGNAVADIDLDDFYMGDYSVDGEYMLDLENEDEDEE